MVSSNDMCVCNCIVRFTVTQVRLSKKITYFPRPTQPSIPPESVNKYQLRLGRQRQVWFIPLADERGVYR